jgi:hypothetical protein
MLTSVVTLVSVVVPTSLGALAAIVALTLLLILFVLVVLLVLPPRNLADSLSASKVFSICSIIILHSGKLVLTLQSWSSFEVLLVFIFNLRFDSGSLAIILIVFVLFFFLDLGRSIRGLIVLHFGCSGGGEVGLVFVARGRNFGD